MAAAALLALTNPAGAGTDETHSPAGTGSLAPSLVSTADGAVLTWLAPDGDGHALRFSTFDGERFSRPGTVVRGEDWFANWADTPGLAVLGDGSWLAWWLVRSGGPTYAYDVRYAVSGDDGASWSQAATVHRDGTQTEHGFVSVFPDGDGAGITWLDGRHTLEESRPEAMPKAMTLRTAHVSPSGGVTGSAMLDERVCDCCQTASAMTDAGPVVVYRNRTADEVRDIHVVRRIDGEWTESRPVHADGWVIGGCPVNGPSVAARGDDVAVAWFTMADAVPVVKMALSQDAGATFPAPMRFSEGSALGRVQVRALEHGWVLAWLDEGDNGSVLRMATFDANGRETSRRELAALAGGRASGFPALAVLPDDKLLAAWTAMEKDADGERTTRVRTSVVALRHDEGPASEPTDSGPDRG